MITTRVTLMRRQKGIILRSGDAKLEAELNRVSAHLLLEVDGLNRAIPGHLNEFL